MMDDQRAVVEDRQWREYLEMSPRSIDHEARAERLEVALRQARYDANTVRMNAQTAILAYQGTGDPEVLLAALVQIVGVEQALGRL